MLTLSIFELGFLVISSVLMRLHLLHVSIVCRTYFITWQPYPAVCGTGLSNEGLPRSKRMWLPSSSVLTLRDSASPEFTTVSLLSFLPTGARTLHCHGLQLRIQRHDCRRRKTSSGVAQRFYKGSFHARNHHQTAPAILGFTFNPSPVASSLIRQSLPKDFLTMGSARSYQVICPIFLRSPTTSCNLFQRRASEIPHVISICHNEAPRCESSPIPATWLAFCRPVMRFEARRTGQVHTCSIITKKDTYSCSHVDNDCSRYGGSLAGHKGRQNIKNKQYLYSNSVQ